MEKQIADFVSKVIKENKISTYYLVKNGIASNTLDVVLQRGNGKGKTYTLKTLKTLMNALKMDSLELIVNGNILIFKV